MAHLHPPARVYSWVRVELSGKLVAEAVLIGPFKHRERLALHLPIDADDTILKTNAVTGDAHCPLDYVIRGVQREVEYDHIVAPDRLVGKRPPPGPRGPKTDLL